MELEIKRHRACTIKTLFKLRDLNKDIFISIDKLIKECFYISEDDLQKDDYVEAIKWLIEKQYIILPKDIGERWKITNEGDTYLGKIWNEPM